MRLTELNPEWFTNDQSQRVGVTFDCPHCTGDKKERLFVPFKNPLDGASAMEKVTTWQREGESFDTLTLNPSINYVGHWHGFIRNGEIQNADDTAKLILTLPVQGSARSRRKGL